MTDFNFNIPRITKELFVQKMGAPSTLDSSFPDLTWLDESGQQISRFYQDLFSYFSSRSSSFLKTELHQYYDFYHDMILRNLKDNPVALRWWEKNMGWQSLTYLDLHQRASLKVKEWENLEVLPGNILCAILPVGVDLAVAFLASLKMGLLFSYLPPLGDQYLARRLKNLKPNHLVTYDRYKSILSGFADIILPTYGQEVETYASETSHTYTPEEPVCLLFSSFSPSVDTPKELPAEQAYFHALRDGMVVYDLSEGHHWAAPEFSPLSYFPANLMSIFLCGATWVHFTLEDLEENTTLVSEHPNFHIGIQRPVRDALMRKGKIDTSKWNMWFRNPAETIDWAKWQYFIDFYGLEKIPFMNIIMDGSYGGTIFFSLKRTKYLNQNVLPSPGTPWILGSVANSGEESRQTYGLFTPKLPGQTDPAGASIILSRFEKEWFYSGTIVPSRGGKFYPWKEVLETLSPLPFIFQSSVVNVSGGQEYNRNDFILLVFVGPQTPEEMAEKKPSWEKEIEGEIFNHLGEEFLPDRIEFYPFYARENEGFVDHEWCRTQFHSGGLFRRTKKELYQYLTLLREMILYQK